MAALRNDPRMPADPEAEHSVLAELVRPLHGHLRVEAIDVDDFYDPRHQRLFRRLRGDDVIVGHGDDGYLRHAVASAWPLTEALLASFRECAAKRRRIVELEAEREALLRRVAS